MGPRPSPSPGTLTPALGACAGRSTSTPPPLADSRLAAVAERLAAIPHVRRLRVHTRLPIVIPERVCDDLLAWLAGSRIVGRISNPSEKIRAIHRHDDGRIGNPSHKAW